MSVTWRLRRALVDGGDVALVRGARRRW
jgi:hypothetical protein